MSINERFFELLKEKGITQKKFCESTGIPQQTVSAWKNRNTDPPATSISTIADFFGVTIGYILTGEEPKYLPTGVEKKSEDLNMSQKQLLTYFNELSEVEQNIILGETAKMYADKIKNKNS